MSSLNEVRQAQVQGRTANFQNVSPLIHSMAFFADLGGIVLFAYAWFYIFNFSPLALSSGIFFLVGIVVIGLVQKIAFGRTLGQWIYEIRLEYPEQHRPIQRLIPFSGKARRTARPSMIRKILATSISIISLIGGYSLFKHTYEQSPYGIALKEWNLEPFAPVASKKDDWMTLPFFYASGAWPSHFLKNPVLHTLPYRKGPPKQFAANIVSRWAVPEIKLILKGPKTPLAGVEIEQVKQCLTSKASQSSFSCWNMREKILSSHIRTARRYRLKPVELKWFEVENPSIPPNERPKGIYVKAQSKDRVDERYVLINAKGAHQSIVLTRSPNPRGEKASNLLKQSIRSLRVFDQLSAGRALVDRKISSITLNSVKKAENIETYVSRMAEVQAALISKISVQPKSYRAYYHLAGTALMMIRHAGQQRVRKNQLLPTRILNLLDELTATSKPLVRTAYLYAKDVDQDNPLTEELEMMFLESQKY